MNGGESAESETRIEDLLESPSRQRRRSRGSDSPKNEAREGKAPFKWVRGTFCKFTKA